MTDLDIPRLRLHNQQIAHHSFTTPADVVADLGAVQAQDYPGGKWAIGLRLPGATDADIERAIADRSIVRTWPMRRTLHFVPAADVRWMLSLTASRAEAGFAARYRQLELDDDTFKRSAEVLVKALSGGRSLARPALHRVLQEAGIATACGGPLDSGQTRGLHILGHHAMTGLICYGPHQGKQPSFVLLDEWLPKSRTLDREEALGELAKRYFTSHGPATVQDYTWWSGLTVRDAKLGIELAAGALILETVDGRDYWLAPSPSPARKRSPAAYLLPPWDEYTVAYRDRSAVVAPEHAALAQSGGLFRPIIVVDGRVVGTWKSSVDKGAVAVTPAPFDNVEGADEDAFTDAARRYARFLGVPLSVE